MNIDSLFTADLHEEGSEMEVRDQFGEPVKMFITLVGRDSRTWLSAELEMKRQLMAGVDIIEATADAMGKCSLGWRGFKSKNKSLEFSRESVTNLYLSAPYIAKQADTFLSNRVNFMKGKLKS